MGLEPLPVGAGIGDRIEHIGHSDDATLQGNLLTLPPLGIARTIEAFVVMADQVAQHLRAWLIQQGVLIQHLLDHGEAQVHVGIHHQPLLRRQRPLLEQHGIGDADLADVVQPGKAADLFHIEGAEAVALGQHLGDLAGVLRHPVEVAAGFKIPEGRKVVGQLGGRIEGTQGQEMAVHREPDQLGQRFEGGLLRLREGRRPAGVEAHHAIGAAVVAHRQQHRGPAALQRAAVVDGHPLLGLALHPFTGEAFHLGQHRLHPLLQLQQLLLKGVDGRQRGTGLKPHSANAESASRTASRWL